MSRFLHIFCGVKVALSMKKWKKEIVILGSIVSIYGINFLSMDMTEISGSFKGQLVQEIQETAERTYFPGIVYEEDEKESLSEFITEKALGIVPLGTYVAAQEASELSIEDEATYEMFVEMQGKDENEVDKNGNLVGEDKSEGTKQETVAKADISLEKLKDFDYLISKFYTVDSVTYVNEGDFDVEKMMKQDLAVSKEEGPKILIFHTHSQETFADSKEKGNASIVDVGEYLATLLNDTYGIETLHHEGVYDKIDGNLDRSKAYELARPAIEKILKENPTIEVVIDLHRDGVGKNTRLVTSVNGKDTAQIMFFNGMCRTRTNGELGSMGNPYRETNLTFSLQMKVAAEETYPGFTRRNYLKGYKYNMDLAPKMLLIEAGAQTNTVQEVKNAMEPLAELLNQVVGY